MTTGSPEDLLPLFLRGDAEAGEQFCAVMREPLRRHVARRAPDFVSRNLVDEAVNEIIALLMRRRPDGFDPSRGSAITFICSFFLQHAIRDVRNRYRPPATRSRHDGPAPEPLPVTAMSPAGYAGETLEDAEIRADFLRVFRGAPAEVRLAAVLIVFFGETMADIADVVGVHPTTIARRLRRWALDHGLRP